MKYKLIRNSNDQINAVFRTDDDGLTWAIPFAQDNTDYQQYLAWLAEGNTPEPAEETA